MTASQAVQLIESGDSIYIQGSTSIPEVLSQALADRGSELKDVTVYAAFAVGRCEAPYCKPEFKDAFHIKSLFVANNIRRWLADGYGTTIPAFLGEIPGLLGTEPCRLTLSSSMCRRPMKTATAPMACQPTWLFPPQSARARS